MKQAQWLMALGALCLVMSVSLYFSMAPVIEEIEYAAIPGFVIKVTDELAIKNLDIRAMGKAIEKKGTDPNSPVIMDGGAKASPGVAAGNYRLKFEIECTDITPRETKYMVEVWRDEACIGRVFIKSDGDPKGDSAKCYFDLGNKLSNDEVITIVVKRA